MAHIFNSSPYLLVFLFFVVLVKSNSRPVGFIAIGEIALAVKEHMRPHIPVIIKVVQKGLSSWVKVADKPNTVRVAHNKS